MRRLAAVALVSVASLALAGCLEPPAESTLAGVLDTSETHLGTDLEGERLEFVCETSNEVLVEPMEIVPRYDRQQPLFEMELTAGDPTYCYFVHRAEAGNYFLGFLGLDPDGCEVGPGADRQWIEWTGKSRYAGAVRGDALRGCPEVDLTRPEPQALGSPDHCTYCGLIGVEFTLGPDVAVDWPGYFWSCIGFEEIEGAETVWLMLWIITDDGKQIVLDPAWTAPLGPLPMKVEQVDGGLGLSSVTDFLEDPSEYQVEAMFHTTEDATGVTDTLDGVVAVRSHTTEVEATHVFRTIDPLLLNGTCTE